ncbi:MAG TPA: hypothetical protein VEK39_07310 [Solirubrobacterales bacterium]|nr:hypothetical protein [Solirubrobacterales bacterium]
MLALTPTAAEVINAIVSAQGSSEKAGMRITSQEGTPSADGTTPRHDLHLSVVDEPQVGDEQLEGAPIYIEAGSTAELLDDKVLDADVSGEEVRFQLMAQAG